MAGPYNFDTSDPTDTSTVASFPANERTFRTTVAGIVGGAIDTTTGMPYLPVTAANPPVAGTYPNAPTGALVFSSGAGKLYINTGTPASPVWLQV